MDRRVLQAAEQAAVMHGVPGANATSGRAHSREARARRGHARRTDARTGRCVAVRVAPLLAGIAIVGTVFVRPASGEGREPAGFAERSLVERPAARELGPGSEGDSGDRVLPPSIGDEANRRALARGLAWLAQVQERAADGSFPSLGARTTSAGTGPAADVGGFAPVAVTALGALAFMAGGSAPDRGPHGRACSAAIDWLVARTDVDPRSERVGYVSRSGDGLSRMHGHGFATLALAQASVMSPHTPRGARVQSALLAAVRCIESSQGVEGGWDYEPRKGVAHENSITITAVQALRAAKEVGVDVDRTVITRAVDYVGRTQKEDGSFRYALGDPTSSVALTAAAIATFEMTGTYSGKPITEGYDFLARRMALRDTDGSIAGDLVVCAFYERLYLAQALWQHPDPEMFRAWWRREAPRVLASQRSDGSWSDPRFGDVYATAMNCLVLGMPEALLPIFQR